MLPLGITTVKPKTLKETDISFIICADEKGFAMPQQKNIELHTFSCNLGSWGTAAAPADVTPPWLEDVSDLSSNFTNDPTWAAAKWA